MLAIEAHQADLIYSDEDKVNGEGTLSDPHFKPDWTRTAAVQQLHRPTCARFGPPRFASSAISHRLRRQQDHDLCCGSQRQARESATFRTSCTIGGRSKARPALSSRAKEYAEKASLSRAREHTASRGTRYPSIDLHVRWRVPEPPPCLLIIPGRATRERCSRPASATPHRADRVSPVRDPDHRQPEPRSPDALLSRRASAAGCRARPPIRRAFQLLSRSQLWRSERTRSRSWAAEHDLEVVDGNWLGEMVGK